MSVRNELRTFGWQQRVFISQLTEASETAVFSYLPVLMLISIGSDILPAFFRPCFSQEK